MYFGFQVEEQQRVLVLDISENKFNSTSQKIKLIERRAKIQRAVARFRTLQRTYTPAALAESAVTQDSTPASIELISLRLPSSLTESARQHPDLKKWVDMEAQYRRAQLSASLYDIRTLLFIRTRLYGKRSLNILGQHASTKARDVLAKNERDPSKIGWRWLKDKDVVSFDDPDIKAVRNRRRMKKKQEKALQRGEKKGESSKAPLLVAGESRRKLSWIWTGVDIEDGCEALQEATRIEWCKAWARRQRWAEELQLLEEEKRRTIDF
ncbi:hypothetical protein MPER_01373 [Moniliophthora perniciosa FA553]|nr:hypothetical protein MPER_01373 [Moniliophthora perniciosa FA553]